VAVGGATICFEAGEPIHTESSYKYTRERFGRLAAAAGLTEERWWTDQRAYFGVGLYRWAGPP
jgi:L-histidine N-alpha-methyltransferase